MTSKADTEARDMYYDAITVSGSDCRLLLLPSSVPPSPPLPFLPPPYFLPPSLSLQAMEKQLFQKTGSGLTLVADVKSGRQDNKMQHLVSNKLSSAYLIPCPHFQKVKPCETGWRLAHSKKYRLFLSFQPMMSVQRCGLASLALIMEGPTLKFR